MFQWCSQSPTISRQQIQKRSQCLKAQSISLPQTINGGRESPEINQSLLCQYTTTHLWCQKQDRWSTTNIGQQFIDGINRRKLSFQGMKILFGQINWGKTTFIGHWFWSVGVIVIILDQTFWLKSIIFHTYLHNYVHVLQIISLN